VGGKLPKNAQETAKYLKIKSSIETSSFFGFGNSPLKGKCYRDIL
jgi:hypothetical protein